VRRRLPAVLVAVALLAVACGDDGSEESSAGSAQTVSFLIPAGTGDAIDAGEPVDILPARIDLAVGDSVEIVNDDERNHVVGPFFVEAGETFRHEFISPGEFEGACSVHPSGRVVVAVT
jgi:plastocyanin